MTQDEKDYQDYLDYQEYLKQSKPTFLEKAKDVASTGAEYAGKGLGLAAQVLDYPMGIARESVAAPIEAVIGKKTLGDIPESITRAAFGKARSATEIAENLGVPKEIKLAPEQISRPEFFSAVPYAEEQKTESYYPSTVTGIAADIAMGPILSKSLTYAGKLLPNVIDRTASTARAIGMTGPEYAEALQKTAPSIKGAETIADFGVSQGIVSPLSTRSGIVSKAKNAMKSYGAQLDSIRTSVANDIDTWMETAPPQKVKAYLESSFNFNNQKDKMIRELYSELEGGKNAKAAVSKLNDWLQEFPLSGKYSGKPSLLTLQKWKKNLGDSIADFSKVGASEPAGEAAYKKALEYVDKAMEAEVSLANKMLKNENTIEAYENAKKNYSLAKTIHDSAIEKLGRESMSGGAMTDFYGELKSGIKGPILQSTMANIPSEMPIFPKLNVLRAGYNAVDLLKNQMEKAAAAGVPPSVVDSQIKHSEMLQPTEKAILRNKNIKDSK